MISKIYQVFYLMGGVFIPPEINIRTSIASQPHLPEVKFTNKFGHLPNESSCKENYH